MTFNNEAVVSTDSDTGSSGNGGAAATYTVPAGKYAIVTMTGARSGGSGFIGVNIDGVSSGVAAELLYFSQTFTLRPGASCSITAPSGGGNTAQASIFALEYNLPS